MVKLSRKEIYLIRFLLNHESHKMTPKENFILLVLALNRPYSIGNKRYKYVINIINRFERKQAVNDKILSDKINFKV